jgi:hypothetical protein
VTLDRSIGFNRDQIAPIAPPALVIENMTKVKPSPRTWTLRFKLGRTTCLLEVDPLQKLSDVRAELLHALQDTNIDGRVNGRDIPHNPDHIKLGRPVDRNDLSLGYTSIEEELGDGIETKKGKGKSAVGAIGRGKSSAESFRNCPQGAGFQNGDVVAFKFVNEDHEAHQEDDIIEQWDVVVPSMEETYGETEQQEDIGDEGVELG